MVAMGDPNLTNSPMTKDGHPPDIEQSADLPPKRPVAKDPLPTGCWPAFGCLCVLVPYYIFISIFLCGLRWQADKLQILFYTFAPFFWPALVAGWAPGIVLKIPSALLGLFCYWRLLRKLQASESLKSMLLSLLGLILLLALSFGGALAAFCRNFEGLG